MELKQKKGSLNDKEFEEQFLISSCEYILNVYHQFGSERATEELPKVESVYFNMLIERELKKEMYKILTTKKNGK